MSAIKKILLPTDFSKASAAAANCACELAAALNASVSLLHVVEYPYPIAGPLEFSALPQEVFDGLDHQARSDLEKALTPEQKDRHGAEFVLRHGSAAEEILHYLREHSDIGLVVMATHGRGGVARLMMGSVADKVVREAPCPVLTIRAHGVEQAGTTQAA